MATLFVIAPLLVLVPVLVLVLDVLVVEVLAFGVLAALDVLEVVLPVALAALSVDDEPESVEELPQPVSAAATTIMPKIPLSELPLPLIICSRPRVRLKVPRSTPAFDFKLEARAD